MHNSLEHNLVITLIMNSFSRRQRQAELTPRACSLVSDALLVAFNTFMRFVAWSDNLYSAFLLLRNTC